MAMYSTWEPWPWCWRRYGISIKGYLIVSGQSKEPMMGLAANAARAVFIIFAGGRGGMEALGWLAGLAVPVASKGHAQCDQPS